MAFKGKGEEKEASWLCGGLREAFEDPEERQEAKGEGEIKFGKLSGTETGAERTQKLV